MTKFTLSLLFAASLFSCRSSLSSAVQVQETTTSGPAIKALDCKTNEAIDLENKVEDGVADGIELKAGFLIDMEVEFTPEQDEAEVTTWTSIRDVILPDWNPDQDVEELEYDGIPSFADDTIEVKYLTIVDEDYANPVLNILTMPKPSGRPDNLDAQLNNTPAKCEVEYF